MHSPQTLAPIAAGTAAALVFAPLASASAAEPHSSEVFAHRPVPEYLHDWGFLPVSTSGTVVIQTKLTATLAAIAAASSPVIASPNPVGALVSRIDRLRSLTDGWLEPGSLAPDPVVLTWLASNLDVLSAASHEVSLIPVDNGSVSLRWADGSDDFTAELRPDNTLYLFVDHTETDDFDELTSELSADNLRSFLAHGISA